MLDNVCRFGRSLVRLHRRGGGSGGDGVVERPCSWLSWNVSWLSRRGWSPTDQEGGSGFGPVGLGQPAPALPWADVELGGDGSDAESLCDVEVFEDGPVEGWPLAGDAV